MKIETLDVVANMSQNVSRIRHLIFGGLVLALIISTKTVTALATPASQEPQLPRAQTLEEFQKE